ncbi:MAG: peptidase M28 family protein, partial [Planctomycetes bacterium]|nr:peptidase M28 family protein [Planctomycetota bacterium]
MSAPNATRLAAMIALSTTLFIAGCASAEKSAAGPLADRYGADAKRIIDATMAGNDAWQKMHELCDGIGHRLSGSQSLVRATEWAAAAMKADGGENVRLEKVMVPRWVRGNESATMLEPKHKRMGMLGLGGSIGTPEGGITAEVVTVRDKAELDQIGQAVKGKIVLFNFAMLPYTPERGSSYGPAVQYRTNGARWASQYGALAALVRSVTPRTLHTPHTGS